MSGTVVQLGNLGATPNGNRYTDAEKESAYFLWRTAGGRSCRRVASVLGIAERTLINWRDQYAWAARANDEDAEDIGSIRHGVAAVVTHQLLPSIETAVKIRDDLGNDAKVRLAAAQWLAGIGGVAAVSKVETAIRQEVQTSNVVDVNLSGIPPDELMRLEEAAKGRKG